MKTTIKDFSRESLKKNIFCPRCFKSNKFEAFENKSGYMVLVCVGCNFKTIMSLRIRTKP